MLNLSYCEKINVKVKYNITDSSKLNKTMISQYSELGIDIFDSKDSFFNDLCYPFSISNSDIILKDRISDIFQNYSLCDNGCEYKEIDIENMTVLCSCNIRTEINIEIRSPAFAEIVENTFKDSNIGVVRCYNLVFNSDHLKHNLGYLIFSFFIITHFVCFLLYFIFGIKSVTIFVYKEMEKNNYITRIFNPKKKKPKDYHNVSDYNPNSKIENSSSKRIALIKKEIFTIKNKNKSEKNIVRMTKTIKKNKLKNTKPIFIFNYKYGDNYYNNNSFMKSKKIYNHKSKSKTIINKIRLKTVKIKKSKINKEKQFPGYYNLIQINANNSLNNKPPESKYILDNYNYEEEIEYDKREFFRIYFIILLSKENILNTFFFRSPLELPSLRFSMFIFSYSCDFALNAVFYLNQKISDKYHYEGDSLYLFTLINNITVSIFSTIVSYLLVKSLNFLTNSKNAIELLFREEEQKMRKNKNYKIDKNKKIKIINELLKVFKIMKIKIVCYIIIVLLLMIFFLYFVTAFCVVYKDTQISWLYDSLGSFMISFLIEFLTSFFISIMYIVSVQLRLKPLYNMALFLYNLG